MHLRREGDWAEFPDSVTARGAQHLAELAAMAAAGQRAVMLYVVQRTDCARFRLAGDLDPAYARAFAAARAAGVEAIAHGSLIDHEGVGSMAAARRAVRGARRASASGKRPVEKTRSSLDGYGYPSSGMFSTSPQCLQCTASASCRRSPQCGHE